MTITSKLQPKFTRIGGLRRESFDLLHDSPTQPRTTYPQAALDKLTEGIKVNGDILQPLMIRKMMPPGSTDWQPSFGFEIIYGHRRKRSGMAAGLDDAPVQEVEMTDEQVQLAQLSENLDRDDLHFVDAAEGIARLRREFDIPIDDLETRTGLGRTSVYNMIKLADACAEVKKACRDGKLDQELAICVARIPSHKLQERALKDAEEQARQNNGVGYRKTRRILLDKYSLYLKDALWALDDAFLVPSAGACTTCPHRSGATPEVYGDVLEKQDYYCATKHGKDVCMNPECFAKKKATQLELDARELERDGKTVVTGNAAKQALTAGGDVKGAYVAMSDVRGVLKGLKSAERPQTVLIQDQRSGKTVEAIKRADLTGAGAVIPDKNQQRQDKQRDEQLKLEQEAKAETKHREALFHDLMARMRTVPRTLFDLRAVAVRMLDSLDGSDERQLVVKAHGFDNIYGLEQAIGQMAPDDIAMVMMSIAVARDVDVAYWEMGDGDKTDLHAMAAHHGFDVAQHRADFEAGKGLPTPSSAAQAQKGGAKKSATKAGAAGEVAESTATEAGAGQDSAQTLALDDQDECQSASPKGNDSTGKQYLSPQAAWPFPDPNKRRPLAGGNPVDTAEPSAEAEQQATEGDAA